MPTLCVECEHCSKPSKSTPPWLWLCREHKRLEGFGFVTRDTWDNAPPFLRCKDVNGGACPLFETRKEPKE